MIVTHLYDSFEIILINVLHTTLMLGHDVIVHTPTLLNDHDDNGLWFAPMCPSTNDTPSKCFNTSLVKKCLHMIRKVSLCQLGQYVIFPSRWWHRGYYTINSGLMYVTAQLFCTAAMSMDSSSRHTRTQNAELKQGKLGMKKMMGLSDDLYNNWDSKYSNLKFRPSKAFNGEAIDPCNNRHLRENTFRNIKELNVLVQTFEAAHSELNVHSVWIIRKTKCNMGFQDWHRDFYLSTSGIIATIVVNVGVYNLDN